MPVHVVVRLPDGREAWVDTSEPVAAMGPDPRRMGPAHRVAAALAARRDPDPGELAEVTAWLDANAGQSEACRAAHAINGPPCKHFPAVSG